MDSIVTLYINKFGIRDNESEEKRVRGLVKKIHEKDSVFCDFPFDYMEEDEQLILLHHIMTSLPERQIMANMKKIDVDRCYMNLRVMGKSGKMLGGGAAQLRRIKEHGGWDAYHEELIGRVTKKVYEEVMEEMNRPVLKVVK